MTPERGGPRPRFAAVVFDADSTLSGIEGVDWLAALRGEEVGRLVAELTAEAMAGRVPLEAVYGRRLELIAPTAEEMEALGAAYVTSLAPGAVDAVRAMQAAGVELRVVSGGLRPALLPLARALGVAEAHVHAVEVRFDADGRYDGLRPTPLTTSSGKAGVVATLGLPRSVLAVGDGATDLAMRPAVDAFAAYTGFVRRAAVVEAADLVVGSFRELAALVLEPRSP